MRRFRYKSRPTKHLRVLVSGRGSLFLSVFGALPMESRWHVQSLEGPLQPGLQYLQYLFCTYRLFLSGTFILGTSYRRRDTYDSKRCTLMPIRNADFGAVLLNSEL